MTNVSPITTAQADISSPVRQDIALVEKPFSDETPIDEIVKLLNVRYPENLRRRPTGELLAARGVVNAASLPCGADAPKLIKSALGLWWHHKVADPQACALGLSREFSKYPAAVCVAAVDALSLTAKFLPALAEFHNALEAASQPIKIVGCVIDDLLMRNVRQRFVGDDFWYELRYRSREVIPYEIACFECEQAGRPPPTWAEFAGSLAAGAR